LIIQLSFFAFGNVFINKNLLINDKKWFNVELTKYTWGDIVNRKLMLLLLLMTFCFFLLFGCYSSQATEPTENTMVISIENHAHFSIYQFEIDTAFTGNGMAYADGSIIKKGDIMSMVFDNHQDFTLKGNMLFDFFLISENNERIYLGQQNLTLKPNQAYHFEVHGTDIQDVELVRVR